MKFRTAAVLAILLLAAPSPAAEEPPAFRFSREIESPKSGQEELIAVPLDSDIYASTQENLSDLRIVDPAGQAVPFLMRKQMESRPQTVRRTWTANNPELKPLEGGGLEIRTRLDDKDVQPKKLRLISPLKNFEQRVQVFGIDAGGAEKPLVSDALIFDYSRYMDVNQNEISLSEGAFRQFRIVVQGVTSDQESQLLELTRRLQSGREQERQERITIERRPFRIDRIEFQSEETRARIHGEAEQQYPVEKFTAQTDAEHRQTIIEINTRREPLVAFHLETSSRNFNRNVTVQVPESQGGRTVWRNIAAGTIARFQFRDLNREELRIPFSESRHAVFRVVIDNRDSPPLEIVGLRAEGHLHQLVLLAASNASYRLEYGAEVPRPPDYDTAALRAALDRGIEPAMTKLGPPLAASTEPAAKPPLDFRGLLNNPIAIGALIVVLVLALGWSLYRAGQRIEDLPRDEV